MDNFVVGSVACATFANDDAASDDRVSSIEPEKRDTREHTRRQRVGQRPFHSNGENDAGLYEEPRRKMTSGDANVSSDSNKTVVAAAVAPTTL